MAEAAAFIVCSGFLSISFPSSVSHSLRLCTFSCCQLLCSRRRCRRCCCCRWHSGLQRLQSIQACCYFFSWPVCEEVLKKTWYFVVCVCVLLMLLIKRFSFLLFIFYFCLCTSVPAIVSAAFCRVCGFFLLFSLSVWLPTNVSAGSRHLSTTTTITICHNNFAFDCPLRSFSCFFNSPKIPSAETFSYLSVDCVSDWLAAVAGKCVIINHQKRGVMKPKNEK